MIDRPFLPLNDSHVHVIKVEHVKEFSKLMDAINAEKVGLACQSDLRATNDNPAGFCLKASDPDRFYMIAGLDHSAHYYKDCDGPSLADQARNLYDIGVDGVKILAGKPNVRKRLDEPMDGPYFSDFFSVCEELDIPLLWHIADPEEFWNPSTLPQWAQNQGWGYDDSFPQKEDLYKETENVLNRHPRLRVVLAHFYFLSADLERAEKFLNKFPNACFDLAPGIEMFYNLSGQWEKARDFFCKYADRIFFGTDIMSPLSLDEACARAGIVYRFLLGEGSFKIPEEADFLLGKPVDGTIRGLALTEEAASSILQACFLRQFGESSRRLNVEAAKEECERLAIVESQLKSCTREETDGGQALEYLI
jgi:predicted TIM-barrel fold metal-dependent hydrolase